MRVLGLAALVMVLLPQALPWATLDATTKYGPIDVQLHAEVSSYGVAYDAKIDTGGAGGIIGGLGGALGAGANIDRDVTISEQKTYLSGLGSFQQTIGFVKGSGKERSHTLSPFIHGSESSADVRVTTQADLIPWWPVGSPQGLEVSVMLLNLTNATDVLLTRVWVEVWRESAQGGQEVATAWERQTTERLTTEGQIVRYRTAVTIPDDFGKFAVVGRAAVVVHNSLGQENLPVELIRSFEEETGPPKILL